MKWYLDTFGKIGPPFALVGVVFLSTFFSWGPLDVLRPFALPSSFLVFLFYIVWCMMRPK